MAKKKGEINQPDSPSADSPNNRPQEVVGSTGDVPLPGDGPLVPHMREGDVYQGGDGPLVPSHRYGAPCGPWDGFPFKVGFGYHSDTPDHRDYTLEKIRAILSKTHKAAVAASRIFKAEPGKPVLKRCDLREAFDGRLWAVRNQGPLHSCTAHAVIGLIEFLLWRGLRERSSFSRLFLYNTARRLLFWTGDSGATLRVTFKAVEMFGIPDEKYWPYDLAKFAIDPDAFLYGFANDFRSLLYTRLDEYGLSGGLTLNRIKIAIEDGFPIAFGFPIYSSVGIKPEIPFPDQFDQLMGSHAALAVGFDDHKKIGEKDGALIFRNSWGQLWGEGGYGYLPYKYVEDQLAVDFWTSFNGKWLNRNDFKKECDIPNED